MITLINGNSLHIPLANKSVQMVCTSPPYWGLRDYGTAEWIGGDPECDHKMIADGGPKQRTNKGAEGHVHRNCKCGAIRQDRQLGLEATPEEYVANMVAVFREVWRVLRDDGTVWLNLGDSYANTGVSDPSKVGGFTGDRIRAGAKGIMDSRPKNIPTGLKPKDLVGIPWRVAFALQADGWYLRSDIIWAKPNPMPESVTDRPTKAHEYVFLLSKQARYYYDAEAIREESQGTWNNGGFRNGGEGKYIHDSSFINSAVPARGACSTSLGGSTLRPKLHATLHTDNGALDTWGWLDFGQSKIPVNGAMTFDAKRFQVIEPIGFQVGIETPERQYVMNLEIDVTSPTSLTSEVVTFLSQPSLSAPVHTAITDATPAPCGAILASHIETNPLPRTFAGAKVMALECALVTGKFFSANIALEIDGVRITVFVFTTLWSSHVGSSVLDDSRSITQNPAGRNRRTVWTIATQPYSGAHFATFPEALVEPCIKAGTSERGCCPECGKAWVRVVETERKHRSELSPDDPRYRPSRYPAAYERYNQLQVGDRGTGYTTSTTIGWQPACDHNHDPIPCTVFDPFAGTATVGVVANRFGRSFVGLDLSLDYIHLAVERIKKSNGYHVGRLL